MLGGALGATGRQPWPQTKGFFQERRPRRERWVSPHVDRGTAHLSDLRLEKVESSGLWKSLQGTCFLPESLCDPHTSKEVRSCSCLSAICPPACVPVLHWQADSLPLVPPGKLHHCGLDGERMHRSCGNCPFEPLLGEGGCCLRFSFQFHPWISGDTIFLCLALPLVFFPLIILLAGS